VHANEQPSEQGWPRTQQTEVTYSFKLK